MSRSIIHNVSRAVIKSGDQVLLTHPYGMNFTYLPGGHIEEGETALQAVERELREELAIDYNELKFLGMCGIVEANFPRSAGKCCHYHEIEFIFLFDLPEAKNILSKEGREDFVWHRVTELENSTIFPSSLKKFIPEWTKGFSSIPLITEMLD